MHNQLPQVSACQEQHKTKKEQTLAPQKWHSDKKLNDH